MRNRIGTTKSFDGSNSASGRSPRAAASNRTQTISTGSMARQAANKEFKEENGGMSLENNHSSSNGSANTIPEKDDEK